jgi:membrane protease YdiL (CAAX protease family)
MQTMNQEHSATSKCISVKAHIVPLLFIPYFFLLFLVVPPIINALGISSTIGSVIINGVMNLLPLLIYSLFTKQHIKTILPPASLGVKNGIYITLISFACVFFVLFVNFGHFDTVFNGVVPESAELPGLSVLWITLIAFGIFTATFEELWFRGPVYLEYKRRGVSVLKAALLSGLLFGIVHSGIFQISYTALFGILWAYMLYYTRSIWAPILGHIILNFFNILLNPFFFLNDEAVFLEIYQTYTSVIGVLTLVMIPIAIVCMKKLITNNPREKEVAVKESKLFTFGYWALIAAMIVIAVLFQI